MITIMITTMITTIITTMITSMITTMITMITHLWIMERALLVDGVHAEVDGGAGHAVEMARVVAHWTVPRGI